MKVRGPSSGGKRYEGQVDGTVSTDPTECSRCDAAVVLSPPSLPAHPSLTRRQCRPVYHITRSLHGHHTLVVLSAPVGLAGPVSLPVRLLPLVLSLLCSVMASTASSADSNGVLSSLIGRAPQYKDGHDAVMFALHTHLLRRSLVCHALTPPPLSTSSSQQQPQQRELPYVPPGWNSSDDSYSFTYHHSTLPHVTIVVKGVKMGGSLIVHAIRQRGGDGSTGSTTHTQLKDDVPASVELSVSDYVNSTASLSDYRSLYKDLGGLLLLFDSQVAARILPPPPAQSSIAAFHQPNDVRDPLRVPPVRSPFSVGEEDEDRLRDPRFRPRVGDFEDDLNPLGGLHGGRVGGSLMGPGQFPYGGPGGVGPHRPTVPGLAPRFDPYGPVPGMSEPDFDELVPPGLPGQAGPRGPFGGQTPFGRGRGGGGGFGGGGFGGPFM